MNTRIFYFFLSSLVSIMLFLSGILVLLYFNTSPEVVAELGSLPDTRSNKGFFGSVLEPFQSDTGTFNILILGGDKVNKNTDTILLANFNSTTGKITLMSIPRDTKAEVKGRIEKINAAYPRGGGKLAIQSVSKLLNTGIQYYAYIDTSAFRKLIDAVGGVEFYIPQNMDYVDPTQNLYIHLKKGLQRLDGKKAEQFMRFRQYNDHHVTKFYDGSDLKRIQAQQAFIREAVKQKANLLLFSKFRDLTSIIFSNLETDMPMDKFLNLFENPQIFSIDNVKIITLPGSTKGGNGWYYIKDKEETADLIKKYFSRSDSWSDDKTFSDRSFEHYSDFEKTFEIESVASIITEKPIRPLASTVSPQKKRTIALYTPSPMKKFSPSKLIKKYTQTSAALPKVASTPKHSKDSYKTQNKASPSVLRIPKQTTPKLKNFPAEIKSSP